MRLQFRHCAKLCILTPTRRQKHIAATGCGYLVSSTAAPLPTSSFAPMGSNGKAAAVNSSCFYRTPDRLGGGASSGGSQSVLSSLQVTPANPSIPAGLTQAFKAIGTFSNGSTQDLTASVT